MIEPHWEISRFSVLPAPLAGLWNGLSNTIEIVALQMLQRECPTLRSILNFSLREAAATLLMSGQTPEPPHRGA